ncbi:hypothetical protein NC651_034474 [Populus alba x Populus x berolinensis]|nr:hypothetical protein NC651_034474 [Populus alba x Populus x berolinensis]
MRNRNPQLFLIFLLGFLPSWYSSMAPLAAIPKDLLAVEKQNKGRKPNILQCFYKPFLPFLRLRNPALTTSRHFTPSRGGLFPGDQTHSTIDDRINKIPICFHLLKYI